MVMEAFFYEYPAFPFSFLLPNASACSLGAETELNAYDDILPEHADTLIS